MSAPAENITQVSSMPIPPMHYVKLYTDEAVKKGTAPKYATPDNSKYLVINHYFRPPPPLQDTYSMFGVTVNNDDAIIQSLESQVILKFQKFLVTMLLFAGLQKIILIQGH